jgi:hypothetical protein
VISLFEIDAMSYKVLTLRRVRLALEELKLQSFVMNEFISMLVMLSMIVTLRRWMMFRLKSSLAA